MTNGATVGSHTTTDWSHIGPTGHAVQFYAGDDELIPLLAGYVGTAVVAGDAAIMIATRPHREAVETCLASRGLSLDIARRQGRLVELDAADTLASMCRDTRIDPERMRSQAIRLIQGARAATRRPRGDVAVFGEMVSLLWSAARVQEAVELEELWNDVQRDVDFSMMCAYPMKAFAHDNDAAPFLRVCAQHSHIFPTQQKRLLDPVSPLA